MSTKLDSTHRAALRLMRVAMLRRTAHLTLSPEPAPNETALPEALGEVPQGIGTLQGLKLLNLRKNELQYLPAEIGDLRELTVLLLEDNKLTTLPGQLYGLRQLMTLDLRHNRFDDLPLFLGWMPHLQTLLVDGNPLTCLPRCVVRAGNDAVLKWIKHKAMESTQPRWV